MLTLQEISQILFRLHQRVERLEKILEQDAPPFKRTLQEFLKFDGEDKQ